MRDANTPAIYAPNLISGLSIKMRFASFVCARSRCAKCMKRIAVHQLRALLARSPRRGGTTMRYLSSAVVAALVLSAACANKSTTTQTTSGGATTTATTGPRGGAATPTGAAAGAPAQSAQGSRGSRPQAAARLTPGQPGAGKKTNKKTKGGPGEEV